MLSEYQDFKDIEDDLQSNLNKFRLGLSQEMAQISEMFDEDIEFTEKVHERLSSRISKWFKNLVLSFKKFMTDIRLRVKSKAREKEYFNNLRDLQKKLKEQKAKGAKKVRVTDVWTIRKVYEEAASSIIKDYNALYKNKITRAFRGLSGPGQLSNRYKYIEEVDRQLEITTRNVQYWNKQLESIADKTVEKDIDFMLRFMDKELTNRSEVTKKMTEAMTLLEQVTAEVEYTEDKVEIYGSDLLMKKTNILKQICTGIVSFFKRWTVKAISAVVFFFA